ncbi:MAG TPA: hypothetical protein VN646_16865 [Candidatus Acidoferrum sp.]|nr:hypothetical protein [Candidatus Acidoferrum sp.]
MTTPERARELKAVLDAVRTNAEARRMAATTATRGTDAIAKLGAFTSAGMREQLANDVLRVTAAAAAIPDDNDTVVDSWNARPGGLRVAIESLTANVWSQEKNFPEGTSVKDDFALFGDGFIDALKAELQGLVDAVPQVADALGGLLWPLAIAAVGVLVIVVLVKRKAVQA